jgi:hypothetical protein
VEYETKNLANSAPCLATPEQFNDQQILASLQCIQQTICFNQMSNLNKCKTNLISLYVNNSLPKLLVLDKGSAEKSARNTNGATKSARYK